jgi:hypothetical protein
MKTGILYQLSGLWTAELCVISLYSLRKHYAGPITLFVTDDCLEVADAVRQDKRLRVDLQRTELPRGGRRPHWVAKTFTYIQTPYDYSLYIDSDTIVLADPSCLFGHLVLPKCADLRILDDHQYPKSVRAQFRKFREHGPVMSGMIDRCYKANRYVVNNGVFGFAKDHPLLYELHHLCIGLRDEQMHDEIAMQLCLPRYDDVRWVEGQWNALVAYEKQWDDRKIAHYHHKYYAKLKRGRETWTPHLLEAMDQNIAGLRDWAGKHNPHVAGLLGQSQVISSQTEISA